MEKCRLFFALRKKYINMWFIRLFFLTLSERKGRNQKDKMIVQKNKVRYNRTLLTMIHSLLIITRTVSDLTEWYPRPHLQYYDVQTFEYRYISKLPMKNERKWSYVKETTSHLQNKLTKNIHLGVATRYSRKWDCLNPIRFHQYTWGLQHFLTF